MKNWLAGREECLGFQMRQDEILRIWKNLSGSLLIQPFCDVPEDFFSFIIIHQKVVGALVVVVGAGGGFGNSCDEAADIGIGIEKVVFAVKDKGGDLDSFGANVHTVDETGESSEEAQGVFFDIIGVGFGLFSVKGILGNLNVLLAG